MDCKPINTTLIHHRVTSLNAEAKLDPKSAKGGVVEFIFSVECPDDGHVVAVNETFSIYITLECTGRREEGQTLAFSALCKMEGIFKVFSCPGGTISFKEINSYNSSCTSQLIPLVANQLNDILVQIGYRSIQVPPYIPAQDNGTPKTTKTTHSKASKAVSRRSRDKIKK